MVNNSLGLDVGEVRVGVAMARSDLRIPVPLTTLSRKANDFWEQVQNLIKHNDIGEIIIGLPRGLDGQETAQTASARAFGTELASYTTIPLKWQDEALTSVKAEDTLIKSGKPYIKTDIDALAACYILNDYIETNGVRT